MFKNTLITTLLLMVLCGIVYPLLTTAAGQLFFSHQANGSLLKENGKVVGSALIGQEFTSPVYLHGRPSSHNYSSYSLDEKKENIVPVSGGTNYSNNNEELLKRIKENRAAFSKENGVPAENIPVNILTASASGLDSYITKQAAEMQINRIVKHSRLSEQKIRAIMVRHTIHQSEEDIVNVLAVNLDLKKQMQP